ncbi:MAG: matrixin family metalloprotease, partial [Gammaproteobacteria bacterium]|nr:matrixin family metalloprotease [Gammaproteobacteria bacterium]
MNPNCVIARNESNGKVEFMAEQTEWDGKWDNDVLYYDVEYHESLKLISKRQLKRAVNLAISTWNFEIPTKFKSAWNTKADIEIRFRTKDEDNYFKEKPSVLAYAYFPNQGSVSGQVVFNASYIWDLKGKGIRGDKAIEKGLVENAYPDNILKTYNIYAVLIHELGHTLGLKHDVTGAKDGSDVMDPYYSVDNLDLSDRDIYRIRVKYGQRLWSRFKWYNIIKRW